MDDKLNKQDAAIYESRHDERLRLECLRMAKDLFRGDDVQAVIYAAELMRNYIRLGTPFPPAYENVD